MSDELKPHLPDALAAAGVYPEIVAYLNECHAEIVKLRRELERTKELADKRRERMHRYLDLEDNEWVRMRDARDEARAIAVDLEQQNARALDLLEASPEGWRGNSANINAAIAVLRGDDAED